MEIHVNGGPNTSVEYMYNHIHNQPGMFTLPQACNYVLSGFQERFLLNNGMKCSFGLTQRDVGDV